MWAHGWSCVADESALAVFPEDSCCPRFWWECSCALVSWVAQLRPLSFPCVFYCTTFPWLCAGITVVLRGALTRLLIRWPLSRRVRGISSTKAEGYDAVMSKHSNQVRPCREGAASDTLFLEAWCLRTVLQGGEGVRRCPSQGMTRAWDDVVGPHWHLPPRVAPLLDSRRARHLTTVGCNPPLSFWARPRALRDIPVLGSSGRDASCS